MPGIEAQACDAAEAASLQALFATSGPARLVVYNAGQMLRGGALELDPEAVAAAWRVTCLGGLHAAQAALPGLQALGGGTLIFTGAHGPRCAAARASPASPSPRPGCVPSPSRWRASSGPRASTWRMP